MIVYSQIPHSLKATFIKKDLSFNGVRSQAVQSQVVQSANLTWQDDVPVNAMFDDPYFSLASGEAESQYVFLKHNHLPEAFSDHSIFSIAETGFGTGLNFFVTASHWIKSLTEANTKLSDEKNHVRHLYYFSIEKFPIRLIELVTIHQQWPQYQMLSEQLIEQYSENITGFHQIDFPSQNITLVLMVGDVEDMLNEMQVGKAGKVDAWYLDGFSPSKNPDMWTESIFKKIAKLSHNKTTFATFTAAGFVRRAMKAAGFGVKKSPGFGKKREMLHGIVVGTENSDTQVDLKGLIKIPPWFSLKNTSKQFNIDSQSPVVIIGGGISGLSCALALAERNIHSILLEKSDSLGAGASGNPAGIVMPRINAADDDESKYYIDSFCYAVNYYNRLKEQFPNLQWEQNGVLRFDSSKKMTQIQKRKLPENLVKRVSAKKATQLANINVTESSLYMPKAGTINPLQLCHILAKAAGDYLQIIFRADISSLEKKGDNWLIKDETNQKVYSSEKVIIANGYAASQLLKTENLTVESNRGQLTCVSANTESSKLRVNLCGEGYVVPAYSGTHIVGATYGGQSLTLVDTDHDDNITNANKLLGGGVNKSAHLTGGLNDDSSKVSGRVSFRTTTQDHLPVVGPVIDEAFFQSQYYDLCHGKPYHHYEEAEYVEGLFLSVGHGSRGLVTCISSAKYVVSLVTGQPITEMASTVKLLHPGRFIVRSLKRKKLNK